ncbi:hemagglutinin [Anopheles sinensis]|uniref:Hemagglutinin n=1 Tax=Anopheles sinensis TaxID=74873 RepID=A0A084VFB8_ANOSI|nr:hemagglutinin [Anopheles sinensis]
MARKKGSGKGSKYQLGYSRKPSLAGDRTRSLAIEIAVWWTSHHPPPDPDGPPLLSSGLRAAAGSRRHDKEILARRTVATGVGKLVHLQIYFRKPTPNSVGPDSPFTIPPHPLHPRRTSSPLRTAARSENGTTPKSFPTVASARKLSEIFARIRSVSAGYRVGEEGCY